MPSVDLRPADRPASAPPLARTVKPGRTLCRLAEAGATGVLTVQGNPDGVIRLRDGLVVGVRVRGRPAPVRPTASGSLGVEAAALLDTADRLFVLCSGRIRECRFTPAEAADAGPDGPSGPNGAAVAGDPNGAGSAGSTVATAPRPAGPEGAEELPGLAVDRLLAEVDRRIAALSAVEPVIDPLTDLVRHTPGRLPDRAAARLLSTREQALLTAVDGASTCAGLAAALGRSTFGTALDVSRLVRVGRLEVLPADGAPSLALNRRRPGSGPIRPRTPAPATFDPSDPDVADRLLAALDSLRPTRRRIPPTAPSPPPNGSAAPAEHGTPSRAENGTADPAENDTPAPAGKGTAAPADKGTAATAGNGTPAPADKGTAAPAGNGTQAAEPASDATPAAEPAAVAEPAAEPAAAGKAAEPAEPAEPAAPAARTGKRTPSARKAAAGRTASSS